MSDLRDLIVSIDFNDINVNKLLQVDSAMNAIEDNFRAMDSDINDASREFSALGATASGALNEIKGEANQATRAVNHLGNTDAQPDGLLEAIVELAALEVAADAASAAIQNGSDDGGNSVQKLGGAFSFVTSRAVGLTTAWTLGIAAAIAAGAPLIAATMGIAASLAAAGTGAVAFGAVAVSVLGKVFQSATKVDQIQKKIDSASTAKERIKAEKELSALYDGMSTSQRGALKELQSFKKFWGDFTKQFEKPIFDTFGASLALVKNILPGLAPTITAVSGVISGLIGEMNTSVEGGGLKGFFSWLEMNAAPALDNFAHISGNVLGGFFSLLQSFAPYGAEMEVGLLSLSDGFKTWADGLSSSTAFQDFMDYANANGPVLLDTIGNIWDIFTKLITDLAPFGSDVLNGIKDFTGYINDNWPAIRETVIGLGSAIGTMAIGFGALSIIGTVTTLINAFRDATLLATIAEWGFNAALLANPITWVVIAIGALVGITIVLWRNWDLVKTKATELYNKFGMLIPIIGSLFGPIGSLIGAGINLIGNWNNVKSAAVSAWNGAASIITQSINTITSKINGLIGLINHIPGVNVPKIPTVYVPASKPTGVADFRKLDGSHANGLYSVPWDGYAAELHKNETVLTATQSDALKQTGILGSEGPKPKVTIDSTPPTMARGTNETKTNINTFSPHIEVHVNGNDGQTDPKAIAQEVKKEIEKLFLQLNLQL